MRPGRRHEIRALIEEKAIIHSELRRPLGLAGFRRVLARERVELILRAHSRIAQLMPRFNGWAIIIDRRQSPEERLVCGCHELAHLWLHHDPFFARYETMIYDKSPPWYDALREEEADAFAELLVRGPESPAKRAKTGSLPRRAKQLELADPDGEAFLAMVKRAPKDLLLPPDTSPTVQFAIPRDVWSAVRLEAARYPHYDNAIAGPNHQLVTCPESAAVAIVEQLARAGHKRTAARIRRAIRETRGAHEGVDA